MKFVYHQLNYILAKVSQHLADSQRKDAQHLDEERLCTKTCPLNRISYHLTSQGPGPKYVVIPPRSLASVLEPFASIAPLRLVMITYVRSHTANNSTGQWALTTVKSYRD